MKTRRTLYRLALLSGLGLALMAVPGQENTLSTGRGTGGQSPLSYFSSMWG